MSYNNSSAVAACSSCAATLSLPLGCCSSSCFSWPQRERRPRDVCRSTTSRTEKGEIACLAIHALDASFCQADAKRSNDRPDVELDGWQSLGL